MVGDKEKSFFDLLIFNPSKFSLRIAVFTLRYMGIPLLVWEKTVFFVLKFMPYMVSLE